MEDAGELDSMNILFTEVCYAQDNNFGVVGWCGFLCLFAAGFFEGKGSATPR